MKSFLKNNSRTLVIIGVVVALFYILSWFNRDKTAEYFNDPESGQIYVLQEDNSFAVMQLEHLENDQYFFRNYLFIFQDAIPKRDQILAHEFDLNFMAIYEREEINRLYQSKRIVRIYPA